MSYKSPKVVRKNAFMRLKLEIMNKKINTHYFIFKEFLISTYLIIN